MAARWITCVGRTRSKMASVALRSRRSPSFARQEDPRRVLLLRRLGDVCSNSHAVQAGAAGDHADDFAVGFRHLAVDAQL